MQEPSTIDIDGKIAEVEVGVGRASQPVPKSVTLQKSPQIRGNRGIASQAVGHARAEMSRTASGEALAM